MAERVKLGANERPEPGESAPRASRQRAKQSTPRSAAGGGRSSSASESPPVARLTPEERKLHASLVRFYTMVGMGVHAVSKARGDVNMVAAGVNITSQASDTADAWLELSQQNPQVKRMLQGFVQGSAVANLAGSHVAMIAPILAARGMVPAQVGLMFLSEEAVAAGQEAAMQAQAAAHAAGSNGATA